MFKRFLKKILGISELESKIQEQEEFIRELGWDKNFEIYTRQYLKIFNYRIYPKVVFLDINDMHKLNTEFGYHCVNMLVKKMLSERKGLPAFRWFSGDEIIIFGHSEFALLELVSLMKNHLDFEFAIGDALPNHLPDAINKLSIEVLNKKEVNLLSRV